LTEKNGLGYVLCDFIHKLPPWLAAQTFNISKQCCNDHSAGNVAAKISFSTNPVSADAAEAFRNLTRQESTATALATGLPDYSWCNIPKREKYTKMAKNIHTKCPKNIPSGSGIGQMVKNVPGIQKHK
jgi:hypothetical protein